MITRVILLLKPIVLPIIIAMTLAALAFELHTVYQKWNVELADLLNHFGSSLFSHKPSAIVIYSADQWGAARAAIDMRTFLSELGYLPVSAMIQRKHRRYWMRMAHFIKA